MVREKSLENENFPWSVKSHQSGKLTRNNKSQEFKNFQEKKLIVNRLLKSIVSINCKQFIMINIKFLKFMV